MVKMLYPMQVLSAYHFTQCLMSCSMSGQDIWLRKYHELWEKLEENTQSSFCNVLWKWLVHKHF